ncbi:hypothetical protein YC2023_025423 [Brassica napus]
MLITNGAEIGSYTVILPHSYNNQNKTDTSLSKNFHLSLICLIHNPDNGGDLRRHLEKLVEAEKVQDFIKKNHFGQEAISKPSESWEFYREAIGIASVLVHALDLQSFILRARVLTLYRQALKIAQRAPPHARDSCSSLCELYIDGTMTVKPGTQTVSIVGSNRFGLYGSEFGWGKPVGCETVFIDCDEAFSMSERRDEPGVVEIEAFV